MTAEKDLKSYIDRVLDLKKQQDDLSKDIRDIYADAKMDGFDKTIMGKLVAHLRKVDKLGDGAVTEAEDIFDTYLQAYNRASGTPVATRRHTHEEEVRYDKSTGEILDDINPRLAKQIVDGMQTEIGRAALIAAVDIMIEREEAEQAEPEAAAEAAGDDLREPAAAEQGQIIREGDAPRETDRLGGDASCPDTEFQMDRATEGSFEIGSEAAEKGREATPARPEGVDLNHAGAGEIPATQFQASKKTIRDYRPHCLKPDACGSSRVDEHCYSCRKRIEAGEAA